MEVSECMWCDGKSNEIVDRIQAEKRLLVSKAYCNTLYYYYAVGTQMEVVSVCGVTESQVKSLAGYRRKNDCSCPKHTVTRSTKKVSATDCIAPTFG